MASPIASRPRRARLALRVGAGFGVVLLLFVAALLVIRAAFGDIADAQAEVAQLDRAKHAGHAVVALVREQYIHQAHTLITGSTERMDAYQATVGRVMQATQHLIEQVPTEEDRVMATDVAQAAANIDEVFRTHVLPELELADRAALMCRHDAVEGQVNAVVERVQALNHDLEARARLALGRADAVRARAQLLTMACFALAMLAAGLLGGTLIRSIARPIEVIRNGALRIAQGDLTHRIEWNSADELGELAETFNRMTEDLARQQEDRLRAQRLNLLGQVTAGVAHELNNPIGVILGYLRLMKRDGNVSEDRVDILEDEARQCQRIVQDLLEVVRPAELEPEHVDATRLTADVVERIVTSDAAGGVRVRGPAAEDGPRVWADASRLRQVLKNVLMNAIEASPRGGEVQVDVSVQAGEVTIRVTDQGPGVDPAVRDQIFDPFFTTKSTGTGLGLALSRSLIEAHGGTLELEGSQAGAVVVVRLPEASGQDRKRAS